MCLYVSIVNIILITFEYNEPVQNIEKAGQFRYSDICKICQLVMCKAIFIYFPQFYCWIWTLLNMCNLKKDKIVKLCLLKEKNNFVLLGLVGF